MRKNVLFTAKWKKVGNKKARFEKTGFFM